MGLISFLKHRFNRENIYNTKEYWDSRTQIYKGKAISLWPNEYYNELCHQDFIKVIDSELGDIKSKSILDLGCGIGRVSRYLAQRGAYVTGVDFSVKAIEYARTQPMPSNLRYEIKSAIEINDKEKYDIILTCACLVIAARDQGTLNEILSKIYASLKPSGRVLFFEPIHPGFLHRVLKMDLNEFLKQMRSSRFQLLKVEHIYFWPFRIIICNITWPLWITKSFYLLGKWTMKYVFSNQLFGDYKIILASKSKRSIE